MSVTIAANDANILYSPYNWNRTAVRAQTNSCGAYLRAALLGVPSALTFDVSAANATEPAQVSYRIDRGPWTTASVAASIPLTVSGNEWTKHLVEVVVKSTSGSGSRWNLPMPNAVLFTGITASDGTVTAPVARRPLSGLICGDSITEGLRSLGAAGGTITVNDSDARVSWAYLLGEALGAEVGLAGYASQGWNTGGSGFVPSFPSTWNTLYSGASRPVSDPVAPDFIIINHGTNDQADPTTTVTTTVQAILAAYPSTTRVILVQPYGGKWGTELSNAVTSIGNSRLSYVSTAGWRSAGDVTDGTHNSGYINAVSIAPKLAVAVKNILATAAPGAKRRWIKNSTGLVEF